MQGSLFDEFIGALRREEVMLDYNHDTLGTMGTVGLRGRTVFPYEVLGLPILTEGQVNLVRHGVAINAPELADTVGELVPRVTHGPGTCSAFSFRTSTGLPAPLNAVMLVQQDAKSFECRGFLHTAELGWGLYPLALLFEAGRITYAAPHQGLPQTAAYYNQLIDESADMLAALLNAVLWPLWLLKRRAVEVRTEAAGREHLLHNAERGSDESLIAAVRVIDLGKCKPERIPATAVKSRGNLRR